MPRRYSGPLLSGASALNAQGVLGPNEVGGARNTVIDISFSAGTSAGTVVVEAAPSVGYAGTWTNLGTVAWAAASKNHTVTVPGNYQAIRARISVAIVGGTVDVTALVTD